MGDGKERFAARSITMAEEKKPAKAAEKSKKAASVARPRVSRSKIILGMSLVVAAGLAAPLVPEVMRQVRFLMGSGGKDGTTQLVQIYRDAYEQTIGTTTEKFKAVQEAETKSTWLELENANLKVELEKLKFSCRYGAAARTTAKGRKEIQKHAGSLVGRTLASIDFTPPSQLSPEQLYILALAYLKGHEDEKAAYVLTQLVEMQDTDTFKTAQNYLLTGVTWYRLKNYKLADQYLGLALKLPEGKSSIAYQARARLWKAVVAKQMGQESKAQFWMTELVDHNPHSMEAEWVNEPPKAGGSSERKPASHSEHH